METPELSDCSEAAKRKQLVVLSLCWCEFIRTQQHTLSFLRVLCGKSISNALTIHQESEADYQAISRKTTDKVTTFKGALSHNTKDYLK